MKRTVFIVVLTLIVAAGIWAHRPREALPEGVHVDRVVMNKGSRTLELFQGDKLIRSYRVALGDNPVGPKRKEGDGRTPEGQYVLDQHIAPSRHYKSIHISYPSAEDTAAAQARGAKPGAGIEIHGIPHKLGFLGRLHTMVNWTDGCIAVTNGEMDEISRLVADNTPISMEP